MTIPDLKSHLNLLDVAAHLGIEIDPRTGRAHCPFHADKTPSLQFSEAKQICTCFSGRCEAGTMDVISASTTERYRQSHPTAPPPRPPTALAFFFSTEQKKNPPASRTQHKKALSWRQPIFDSRL